MRTDIPQPTRLVDYQPPPYLIDEVALDFRLSPSATRVKARLTIRRAGDHAQPLRLDGEGLRPIAFAIDGRALAAGDYAVDDEGVTIAKVPTVFVLETEVEIDPAANSALIGLYISGGRFCTQCEAEGFRRITWFADRPDVLARFTVRIEADCAYAHLLSNGNLVASGSLPNGRHYAEWSDPFPKPAYLFALVAGELDVLEGSFTTMTGREVALKIYVDPGMAPRAAYALDSLQRAMKWDEETYGREYDLDLFMIVAVRDFNFGAMENKGLNIFNSSLLLADPETATDMDYERIESVVAHEYFHNWTGNRITCRDWFQLCLKEGFTVFRDQGFSADMRGEAVQRIKEVRASASSAVRRGWRPDRPSGPAGKLSEDRQLLYRDDLRKGRGADPHAEDHRRRRCFPPGVRSVFPALGRSRDHGRGFRRLFRRDVGPRSGRLFCLVRTGRHAEGVDRSALERGGEGARPDPASDDRADSGPVG